MLAQSLRVQLLSLLMVLVVWQLVAVGLELQLLPSPLQVMAVMWDEWSSGELWPHLRATLSRVIISFIAAMGLGTLLGLLMGLNPRINQWLDPLLVMLLNMPALVVIILLYIWCGLIEAAAIAAVVINKVPNVAVTLREGTRSLDPQYQALVRVYGVGYWRQLTEVILPQLAPYFLVASRSGLALIWKIVLVVELLGRSDGVGFQLHLAFQMFDVAMILAYSFAFILVVQVIEWLLLQPWERYQRRWREEAC
ncbi:ABC transporter permease [Motiliproteus sp. MSK22-1]|uniref:ABC transporter permease n=1 Tax=Motiliproteus sp. MSK22-1 TaxID=1897630 RepID=UPI0009771098|nr:ABC transporter permease subunit [Motiliproteus sp. MSK22-1]OMH39619.1 ABC transporter permease [Motiliproteus sp. MSK22-1]